VDHTTISRLVSGDRVPSLRTATKLASSLRDPHEDVDTARYLGVMAADSTDPRARVEYALRADESLREEDVRQVMHYYRAVRARRLAERQVSPPPTVRLVAVNKDN
jgi:hypothetical protein